MLKNIFLSVLLLAAVEAKSQSAPRKTKVPNVVHVPSMGEGTATAPAAGQVSGTGGNSLTVRLVNSCFGANLRWAGNPVSPDGIITAKLNLVRGGKVLPLQVSYPGYVTVEEGLASSGSVRPIDPSGYSLPAGSTAALYGNVVELRIPNEVAPPAADEPTPPPTKPTIFSLSPRARPPLHMSVTSQKPGVSIASSSFSQQILNCEGRTQSGNIFNILFGPILAGHKPSVPCGTYMGKPGALAVTRAPPVVSNDQTVVELSVSFPGQNGFCGGYFSPLMVFWSAERPAFTGVSDFPLNPGGKTSWPEAGSPGFFIALDRNGNGVIDAKDELFGETGDTPNGFEVLRRLDSDGNGVIDARDKEFARLLLWRDKNGDGISQASELMKLSGKIRRISLDYQKNRVVPIGRHAEERESALAVDAKTGKEIRVVDIWLAPRNTNIAAER